MAVTRFDDKTAVTAVFNNLDTEKTVSLPVWIAGVKTDGKAETLIESGSDYFITDGKTYSVKDGYMLSLIHIFILCIRASFVKFPS